MKIENCSEYCCLHSGTEKMQSDLNTLCRLCLRFSSDMLPLFEILIGETLVIEIILTTVGLELDDSLDFPRQACQDCIKKVNSMYSFQQLLIKCQSLLVQWKKKGEPISEFVSNNQSSIMQREADDLQEKSVENSINFEETARPSGERIELEPIDIKDEQCSSDDDKTSHTLDNENDEPERFKRKKRRKDPKGVERIPNKCYICETILKNKKDLEEHLESHKHMLPYKCTQCSTEAKPIIYTTVVLLNIHFETHGFNVSCQHCPLRFRTSATFYAHTKYAHAKQKCEYQCEICDKVFTNFHSYRNHTIAHKNLIAQKYKCEFCQKNFPVRRSLLRHQLIHMNEQLASGGTTSNDTQTEMTSCELSPRIDDCNILEQNESDEQENPNSKVNSFAETGTANQLNDEESYANEKKENDCSRGKTRRRTDPHDVKTIPHKCYICDTTLDSENNFNAHLETHKHMLPYKCLQCSTEQNPIEANSVKILNKHYETHSFYYICPLCPLRYRNNNSLSYHKRFFHKGHKFEFVCKICGKVYNDSYEYRSHLATHTQRWRPIKCEACQKVFSSSYFHRKHSKSHLCLRNTEKQSNLNMVTKEMSIEHAEANMTME